MAGNNWNPNAAATMGLEWFADLFGVHDLVANGPWAQRIRSRSAETVNKFTFIQAATLPVVGSTGRDVVLFEVMPADSEIPTGTVAIDTYAPSADQTVTGVQNEAAGVTNLYQAIDEGVANALTDTHYITRVVGGAGTYRGRFGSSGFSATARVLDLSFRLHLSGSFDFPAFFIISLYHVASATAYRLGVVTGEVSAAFTFSAGEINPNTLLPWTPTDIQGFSSGVWALEVKVDPFTSINAIDMLVTRNSVENRVAAAMWATTAALPQSPGAVSTQQFVSLPAAGASWAKPSSGDFTLLVRRPNAPLVWDPDTNGGLPHSPTIPYASSTLEGVEVASPVPGVVSARPTLDVYGQVASIDFASSTKGRTPPILVVTSAPAVSADGLPYYLTDDTTRFVSVSATSTVTQRITPSSTLSYVFVKFLLDPRDAIADLTVKVKRVSDNVQFGSTYTLTADDVRDLDVEINGLRLVSLTLSVAAALVSGTQYYVELATADAVSSGWRVPLLGDATLAGALASFNGSTDFATVAGVSKTDLDMPLTIATQPTAPTGLTVSSETVVPVSAQFDQSCAVDELQQVRVLWNRTALGASWLRYEVQRSDDNGVTWDTFAYGTSSEATAQTVDQELARSTSTVYRVRVVRSDGAPSAWTAASSAITAEPLNCEVLFVSNEQPDLAVGYNRANILEFGFVAADRDVIHEIYGSDKAVAFMESEDPGVAFSMRLLVNGNEEPVDPGIDTFAALRAISRAAVSYVCVLDYKGDRYYAHLRVYKGQWDEPGFAYHADVEVTEISSVPSIAVF